MKKLCFALSCFVALVIFSACASSRIMKLTGERHKIIASSSSESVAYDKAIKDMQEFCRNQGKSYEVIEENAEYTGVDKSTKAAVGLGAAALGAISGERPYYYPHYHSMDRHDDNKVTVEFRCK